MNMFLCYVVTFKQQKGKIKFLTWWQDPNLTGPRTMPTVRAGEGQNGAQLGPIFQPMPWFQFYIIPRLFGKNRFAERRLPQPISLLWRRCQPTAWVKGTLPKPEAVRQRANRPESTELPRPAQLGSLWAFSSSSLWV